MKRLFALLAMLMFVAAFALPAGLRTVNEESVQSLCDQGQESV